MNDMTLTRDEREAKLEGLGCRRKRVEDVRFTQGKGNYVDDLKLPGMLHGDFVRSPYGHARVKSIDGEKAPEIAWFISSSAPVAGSSFQMPVTVGADSYSSSCG